MFRKEGSGEDIEGGETPKWSDSVREGAHGGETSGGAVPVMALCSTCPLLIAKDLSFALYGVGILVVVASFN